MTDATPDWSWTAMPDIPTVYPTDNDPEPAIYGPSGEVLRWVQRPIGFRSLAAEDGLAE